MSQADELDVIDREVGRYLLQHKVVDRARLQEAIQYAADKKIGFRKALLELDLVDLEFLQRFLPQDVGDFSDEELAGATVGDLPSPESADSSPGHAGPGATSDPDLSAADQERGAPASPGPGGGAAAKSARFQVGGADGPPKRLGEYLVDDEVINKEQLQQALEYSKANDMFLGGALISMRMVDEDILSRYIIRQRQDLQKGQKRKKRVRLGDILVARKSISEDQLQQALQISVEEGLRIGEVLLEKGFVNETDIAMALSEQLMIPVVNMKKNPPDPAVAVMVSRKLVTKHQALPYRREGKLMTVAMVDPLNIMAVDDFKQMTQCEIMPVIVTDSDFQATVKTFLGGEEEELLEWFAGGDDGSEESVQGLDEIDQAPIIQLVNKIVTTATKRGVSDIHIDPREEHLVIRFREDGNLRDFLKAPAEMSTQVAARVKVMSSLNIAETRLPQDGKFRLKIRGNVVDFRVSILPLITGEKVVMRILDQSKARVKLRDLGLSPRAFEWFTKDGIFRPNGIVLVTGPTGSGKTSTLYAGLMAIADPKKNIHTVEDPVEFTLPGVSQVQVRPEFGLDFPSVLKSLLRQDPDVILIGEIRDIVTARISLKAAMTGHLVLSTLHTNDAISTIDRFLSMGIDRFLVGTAIKVVLAQRLVKKLCLTCKEVEPGGGETLKKMGLNQDLLEQAELESYDDIILYKSVGCDDCDNIGYVGRAGIFEVIRFDEDITEMLLAGESNRAIYEECRKKGMITLREAALMRVAQGMTGLDEVARLTVPEPSEEQRSEAVAFLEDGTIDEGGGGGGVASAELKKLTELLTSLEGMARGPGAPTGPTATGELATPPPADAAHKILGVFREAWGDGDLTRPSAKLGLERLQHYLETFDLYLSPPARALVAINPNTVLQARVLDALPALTRRAMLLTEKRIEAGSIKLEPQLGDLPELNLDPKLLGIALEQLALNSLCAMMTGGGRVRVLSRRVEGKVEIILADTGEGLSEAAFEAAQAPFKTSRPFGLGLGIPVAKKLVATLGGTLELRSVAGKGTLATLRFPIPN